MEKNENIYFYVLSKQKLLIYGISHFFYYHIFYLLSHLLFMVSYSQCASHAMK